MRIRAAAVAIVAGLLVASLAEARCDLSGADAADVAATRAAIDAACDCDGAVDHATYVRCARGVAKATLSNRTCFAKVMRCATRSTCGRLGAVACCQTSARGGLRASIKPRAERCMAPRGGSACVSGFASACDACTAGGACAPTPTPGPAPTPGCGNGIVDPGEDCDGTTCSALLNGVEVQSTCGAPGTLHACECKDLQCGGCFDPSGGEGELCWPNDQCFLQPGGGPMCISGRCIPTLCEGHNDCGGGAPICEDGHCCVPAIPGPGSICRIDTMFDLPCCGDAICTGDSMGTCCVPSGGSCVGGQKCCTGSCTNGTCP